MIHKKELIILFLSIIVVLSISIYYLVKINNTTNKTASLIEDGWIAGSILKSRADGLSSGLVFTKIFTSKANKFNLKDYENNIKLYKEGGDAKSKKNWVKYKSALRSTASFHVLLDYFLSGIFGFNNNFQLFKIISCLFFSIIFSLLALWVYKEFGIIPASLLILSLVFTPFLMKNVTLPLRSSWIRFLPLVFGFWLLCKEEQSEKKLSNWLIILYVFVVVFIAQSRSYEQTPIILVSVTLPFIYYAFKNKWSMPFFFKRFVLVSLVSLASFITVLGTHYKALVNNFGNQNEAVEYLKRTFYKRSHGSETEILQNLRPRIQKCLETPTGEILKDYIWQKPVVGDFNVLSLLVLALLMSVAIFILNKKKRSIIRDKMLVQKILAMWVVVLFSFFSVICCLVIFKSHAACHKHIDFVFWCITFTVTIVPLIGVIGTQLFEMVLRLLNWEKVGKEQIQ